MEMPNFFYGLLIDGIFPVFHAFLEFLPATILLLAVVSLFENGTFALGFGCTTLAVTTGCRYCKNYQQKAQKIRLLSFIPCGGKLPVLLFITAVLLDLSLLIVVFFYLFSILLGMLLTPLSEINFALPHLKKFSPASFLKNLVLDVLEYLKKLSLGLLAAITILYALQYFGLLFPICNLFAPIFVPLGFASGAAIAALLFGLISKELILGALIAFGPASLGFTWASALSFLVFTLLYTPCIPALTAIRAQLGLKGAIRAAAFSFAVAYAAAFSIYSVAVLISMC
jgi:ferrous iron transport protein B